MSDSGACCGSFVLLEALGGPPIVPMGGLTRWRRPTPRQRTQPTREASPVPCETRFGQHPNTSGERWGPGSCNEKEPRTSGAPVC